MKPKFVTLRNETTEKPPPPLVSTPAMEEGKNKSDKEKQEKEGHFLLGSPTFVELANGRLRCVETGHELPPREKEAYSRSKACRVALIDAAVDRRNPPLNFFRPDPLCKPKLICELTGDLINKTEEHIWKHISGRRFQNKLEQKEAEKLASPKSVGKDPKESKQSKKLSKSNAIDVKKKGKNNNSDGNGSLGRKPKADSSDSEDPEFWLPPVGSRWDLDDGRDRWEPYLGSEENKDEQDAVIEKDDDDSVELSVRTKRMSIAVGPSSFASRKKKPKRSSERLANGS